MIKLDQQPGNYYLRFATYPNGDMQQVLEGQAIVSYAVEGMDMSPSSVSVDPDLKSFGCRQMAQLNPGPVN